MNIQELVIKSCFEIKNIGHKNYNRFVFRCPDEKWREYIELWQKKNISLEPFPFNHIIWTQS